VEQGAIETARGAVIDVFHGSLMTQPGVTQAASNRLSNADS
jgi:hypothetical protein